MVLALEEEEGLAGRITAIGTTVPCNLTVDTGLSNGSWPIYVGFFEYVGSYTSGFLSDFTSGFCWARWPIYVGFLSGFCRVFVGLFGHVGPIYVGFWSWFALGS